MNLQTQIPLLDKEPKISYKSQTLFLGSCFAHNIGDRFEYYKLTNSVNPFGILFHPKAIETFLWMATQDEKYTETDLFNHNEQWHCFDAHSSLSSTNKKQLVFDLNTALRVTKEKIKDASHIFITLGTAWVYRLKAMDMIVANCHKVPQKEFDKQLLSVNEIQQSLQNCLHFIKGINPNASVVFTVSPIRHLKDGFIENNRSKAHLLAAIHQVISSKDNIEYFPSYELMMDELRDYRFYKDDMIHPSETAVQYIWNYFTATWMTDETLKIMNKVEGIHKEMSHKAFNPESKQHLLFLEKLAFKKYQLQQEHPYITF